MLHLLDQLSSPDAGRIGGVPGTVGLVVTGATEQHGPHLPLSVDTAVARALRDRVPGLLAVDVLATPVIDVAMSDPQVAYPGTITLDAGVFAAVVLAHLEALVRAGIRSIALIDFNSPNVDGSARAVEQFRVAHPDVRIIHQSDMDWLQGSLWRAADNSDAPMPDHAGRIETSLSLALYEEGQVGEFGDVVGFTAFADGDWLERLMTRGTDDLAAIGVLGVPAGANRAEGGRIMAALVEDYAAWIDSEFATGLL